MRFIMENNNIDITKRLVDIFELIGVYLNEDDFNEHIEINSIQFVNIILAVEEEFLIRISSDFFDYSKLKCFNDYLNLVKLYIF